MSLLVGVGKKIQRIREKRGITQEQLEEKTGINAKYISAVESGQKNVTIKTLDKIAKGLEIEIYEIFLFPYEVQSEKAVRKALDSLLKEADIRTLNLCLDFLKKAVS
ncbi:MAG: helix-turn-helix transcriptional regulator [Desulfobacteraceae bacterium]|nr:helix-turn-helix transcriptional regulator [Desulfobacteraceae bacterium]